MSAWLVTGASTGIGASVAASLRDQGENVLTLDIRDGDIIADLSDPAQRRAAIETIRTRHSSLKGIVTCAGIASHIRDSAKIVSVNYFGTVQLIDGLESLLSKGARIGLLNFQILECGVHSPPKPLKKCSISFIILPSKSK